MDRDHSSSFAQVVERLNELSVRKAHDPFLDVRWDGPDAQLDPRDPRFALLPDHPLGATAWYAGLTPEARSRLGLELFAQSLRFGITLETTLSRGLLAFIDHRPRGSQVSRYALHEVIEESRHSLMFQTFLERAGCTTQPFGRFDTWVKGRVVALASRAPTMFFVYVLAGEIFVDDDNRRQLRERSRLHPLVARMLQIHVTEEARHIRFAERYLAEQLPELGAVRRRWLRAIAPSILNGNAEVMLQPTAALVRRFAIPRPVLREAFGPGSAHRARVRAVSAPILALLDA